MRIESARQSVHATPSPSTLHGKEKDLISLPDTPRPSGRLDSIDLLRGLVMVVMALDHVRDFFTDSRFDPLNVSATTVPLAFTRLITHFCAPVFVLLAGTGAFLALRKGRTMVQQSWFLLTRGLWLVAVEVTIVRLGWEFNIDYHFAFAQVIWAIGWSMIVLAGLIHLPSRIAGIVGLAMIAGHNLFDGIDPGTLGIWGWPWVILHAGGPITYAPGRVFFIVYPLVPWIGVMAAGFAFGEIFTLEKEKRTSLLLRIGLGLSATFVVLRGLDLYGDPQPWSRQSTIGMSVVSFLNCQKYPPSLLYLLMTLGPAIVSLVFLEKWKGKVAGFFLVFGRVPMFYYVLHLFLVHAMAIGLALVMGLNPGFLFSDLFFAPAPPPAAWGVGLPQVYALWITAVLLLYPLCRWFAGVKQRRKEVWLSYF